MTYIPPATLQRAVESGQLPHMAAMDILSKQNAVAATAHMAQRMSHAEKLKAAAKDVEGYLEREPALRNPESAEFKQLIEAAGEVALDTGMAADDVRVHRMAMRQVFGPKQQVKAAAASSARKADPLADVPQPLRDHWKRLNYTPERMAEEAKYVNPRRAR